MEYPRSGSEKFLKNRVMALSEELPLYRDTYRLLNNLLILTQDFPRFFRYSMGSRTHVADAFPRMCGAEGHYRAQIRLVRAAVGEDRQAGYELETIVKRNAISVMPLPSRAITNAGVWNCGGKSMPAHTALRVPSLSLSTNP